MIAGGAASRVGGSRRDGIALASKLIQFDWFRREAIVAARSSGTAMMNGYRSSRCGIGRAAAIAAKLDFRSREIRSASAFAIVRFVEKILDRLLTSSLYGLPKTYLLSAIRK